MAMPQVVHPPHLTNNPPNDFKGPRGSLQHRCGACSKIQIGLARCAGCKTVRYCSREHQAQHRQEHKMTCSRIKKYRIKLAKEDAGVRNATPDVMTPANAFETHVGHFWGVFSTRDYMRARMDLADTLHRVGTLDSVTEALEHLQDMMRLCKSDNLGVRYMIPAMMIRLDQDQQSYDIIKCIETKGERGEYDWSDIDLLSSDVKNADVFESVTYFDKQYGCVPTLGAVLLLKLKLLADILRIKLARKVIYRQLPHELWPLVELSVIRSPISRQWAGHPYRAITAVQQELEIHVKCLARYIERANEHFFYMILDADTYLCDVPNHMTHGSPEEVLVFLQQSYAAWWEHEDVLELLQSARTIAAKDSEDELEGMMASTTFASNPGSDRTKEELLGDVSLNRLWAYFDDAVEDAVSLGEKKPSEIRRERARAASLEDEDEYD